MNKLYLIIAMILILFDKLITVATIIEVGNNYPEKDRYSVEKNPLALYFFRNFGLVFGTILYCILSLFSFFFAVWLLSFIFNYFTSFTIISSLYLLVILNNVRWLVVFSK